MDTWDCLAPGLACGVKLPAGTRPWKGNQMFLSFWDFVLYKRCTLTLMPEKTLGQTAQTHAGYSPCLFARVRALPAVDLEPLPLMPMSNEMPF